MVRKDCTHLIKRLKNIPGIETVTLTTNGVLLFEYIEELKKAGVDGINISLDSVRPEIYQEITGRDELSKVLDGISESPALWNPHKSEWGFPGRQIQRGNGEGLWSWPGNGRWMCVS